MQRKYRVYTLGDRTHRSPCILVFIIWPTGIPTSLSAQYLHVPDMTHLGWALLTPILTNIRKENPNVNSVHFVSDGPTTKKRNKPNFWFISTVPRSLGFTGIVTQNCLEAGHGGIGGVIKQTADAVVLGEGDVVTAGGITPEPEGDNYGSFGTFGYSFS